MKMISCMFLCHMLVVMVVFDYRVIQAKPKAKGKTSLLNIKPCKDIHSRLCRAWPLGLAERPLQLPGVQSIPSQQAGPATVHENQQKHLSNGWRDCLPSLQG